MQYYSLDRVSRISAVEHKLCLAWPAAFIIQIIERRKYAASPYALTLYARCHFACYCFHEMAMGQYVHFILALSYVSIYDDSHLMMGQHITLRAASFNADADDSEHMMTLLYAYSLYAAIQR